MKRGSQSDKWTRLTALRAIRAELAQLPDGERLVRELFEGASHRFRTRLTEPLVEGYGDVTPRVIAVAFARMLETAEAELRGELTPDEGLALVVAHAKAHLAGAGAD